MIGVIVCTLDRSYSIDENMVEGPSVEHVGLFGYCQRFMTKAEMREFVEHIEGEGFREEAS